MLQQQLQPNQTFSLTQLHSLKQLYHQTTNNNFNNTCPIPVIFGTNITK